MIISIALPHIYFVTYETSSFPVCNRSQYYFPSNYNIRSNRFFKCNWLGWVTAGRKAIASILSGAIYIQLCTLTLLLLLVLLCLPRKNSGPVLHGSVVFQQETPTMMALKKMFNAAMCVWLFTLNQGNQDLTLSTVFTRLLYNMRSESS